MSHRIIRGLKWARALTSRPSFIPCARPRGKKALGTRYEKALEMALPAAARGKWFEYEDENGMGWCQVDFLMPVQQGRMILELKHTWVAEGHSQIEGLYIPVVSMAYGCSSWGMVVAKRLSGSELVNGVKVVGDVNVAAQMAIAHQRVCWHWMGKGRVDWRGSPQSAMDSGMRAHMVPSELGI